MSEKNGYAAYKALLKEQAPRVSRGMEKEELP